MVSKVYIPLKVSEPHKNAPPTAIGVLHIFSDNASAQKISNDVMELDIDASVARYRLRDMARKMIHTQLLARSK